MFTRQCRWMFKMKTQGVCLTGCTQHRKLLIAWRHFSVLSELERSKNVVRKSLPCSAIGAWESSQLIKKKIKYAIKEEWWVPFNFWLRDSRTNYLPVLKCPHIVFLVMISCQHTASLESTNEPVSYWWKATGKSCQCVGSEKWLKMVY